MKPNLFHLALTHEDEVNKPEADRSNFERFDCDGKYLYVFSPKDKLVNIHHATKGDEGNLLVDLLKGMKPDDLQKRFGVTLVKEDENFAYLRLSSKSDADRQDFTTADFVIRLKNFKGEPDLIMIPVLLRYTQPNGKIVTYTLGGIQPNPQMKKESFTPRLPDKFKLGRCRNR